MMLTMYDIKGNVHFEGEDYLTDENKTGSWFMTNHCNVPRKVLKDNIIENERKILLSNFPLDTTS